jgi:TetR/AcrR family transcriptional repressor of nem operon
MYFKGVGSTTLDDVRAASGTSKSQFYQHFADKDALVHAVVAQQGRVVLDRNHQLLDRFNSLRGLELWRDAALQKVGLHNGAYGCELGALGNELADTDEGSRVLLAGDFAEWESLLAAGLQRMKDRGVLRDDADPRALAIGILAALQGGYLLAQVARDSEPMAVALDMALDRVRSFAVPATARRSSASPNTAAQSSASTTKPRPKRT